MKTTLNIPEGLLKEAMRLADIKSKTEAVITALKEFVRQKKIEHIISHAGNLDFTDNWEEARHER